jgi:hypothetical protein
MIEVTNGGVIGGVHVIQDAYIFVKCFFTAKSKNLVRNTSTHARPPPPLTADGIAQNINDNRLTAIMFRERNTSIELRLRNGSAILHRFG